MRKGQDSEDMRGQRCHETEVQLYVGWMQENSSLAGSCHAYQCKYAMFRGPPPKPPPPMPAASAGGSPPPPLDTLTEHVQTRYIFKFQTHLSSRPSPASSQQASRPSSSRTARVKMGVKMSDVCESVAGLLHARGARMVHVCTRSCLKQAAQSASPPPPPLPHTDTPPGSCGPG